MSAAIVPMPRLPRQTGLHILPRVQACASLHSATARVQQRKPPQPLRLVQASHELAWDTRRTVRALQPEIAFYRKYTEGLLRRYITMSFESGRVPALLGRELFRGNVSNYRVQAFDDVVIFVHDMESCLALLEPGARYLVRRIAMEGYNQEETAALTGLSLRSVIRRYAEAIDGLTRILLERRLLQWEGGALPGE